MKELLMNNMWSQNKYINILINVLLFLIAVNVFHYGQLLLPIICLILFIENKFIIKVNNHSTFILLILFSISFFAFSYKLGFYSVMGFCLPMAYYIGCNLKSKNQNTIKTIIYIIALGMATHLILNFIFELGLWSNDLQRLFNKASHYDVWIFERISSRPCLSLFSCEIGVDVNPIKVTSTGTSLNFIAIMSCIYYLIKYEQNKIFKTFGIITFLISFIYIFALGRRTTFVLLFIAIAMPIALNLKNRVKEKRRINYRNIVIITIIVLLLIMLYAINAFGFREFINNLYIVRRFIVNGLYTDRVLIMIRSYKLFPTHLWGGKQISGIVGYVIHDLWGDIYDYAGIIPYLIMICLSVKYVRSLFNLVRNKKIDNSFRLLLINYIVVSSLVMFIEPIMTGASIYFICLIICSSAIYSYTETQL